MTKLYGTTRTVYIVGKLAFKFPTLYSWEMFLRGLLGNMQEATFSKMQLPILCPVLFSIPGGFLTVMPYAAPLTDEEWGRFRWDTWARHGDGVVPCERKRSSIGVLDGRIVAVDYGD